MLPVLKELVEATRGVEKVLEGIRRELAEANNEGKRRRNDRRAAGASERQRESGEWDEADGGSERESGENGQHEKESPWKNVKPLGVKVEGKGEKASNDEGTWVVHRGRRELRESREQRGQQKRREQQEKKDQRDQRDQRERREKKDEEEEKEKEEDATAEGERAKQRSSKKRSGKEKASEGRGGGSEEGHEGASDEEGGGTGWEEDERERGWVEELEERNRRRKNIRIIRKGKIAGIDEGKVEKVIEKWMGRRMKVRAIEERKQRGEEGSIIVQMEVIEDKREIWERRAEMEKGGYKICKDLTWWERKTRYIVAKRAREERVRNKRVRVENKRLWVDGREWRWDEYEEKWVSEEGEG